MRAFGGDLVTDLGHTCDQFARNHITAERAFAPGAPGVYAAACAPQQQGAAQRAYRAAEARDVKAGTPDRCPPRGYASTPAERALLRTAISPDLKLLDDPVFGPLTAGEELDLHCEAWLAHRRCALGYAASLLAVAGERNTEDARLLLAQITEDLK